MASSTATPTRRSSATSSSGVVRDQRTLDPAIHSALTPGWPLARIDVTLRAILRSGAYELAEPRAMCRRGSSSPNMSTSPRPSSTATSRAWSTRVLDTLARTLRPAEFA